MIPARDSLVQEAFLQKAPAAAVDSTVLASADKASVVADSLQWNPEAAAQIGLSGETTSPLVYDLFRGGWHSVPVGEVSNPIVVDPNLDAERAFGARSQLVAEERSLLPYAEPITDHPVFQWFVLLLAVAYALMICAHLHDILGFFRAKREDHRVEQERASFRSSPRAVRGAALIGLLFLASLLVRLLAESGAALPGTMTLLLLTLGACLGLPLLQSGMLTLVGHITLTSDLTQSLVQLKTLLMGIATVVTAPLALLFLFCPRGEGLGWFYLLCLIAALVLLLFLKESLALFLRKKISILHWFLYLCTVECFPVSFMVILSVRW